MRTHESVAIYRPPDEVWAFLTDFFNSPRLRPKGACAATDLAGPTPRLALVPSYRVTSSLPSRGEDAELLHEAEVVGSPRTRSANCWPSSPTRWQDGAIGRSS
jgi:hypothetical protein